MAQRRRERDYPRSFALLWMQGGRIVVTDYYYDGKEKQQKYTYPGFVTACIAEGRKQGRRYCGKVADKWGYR